MTSAATRDRANEPSKAQRDERRRCRVALDGKRCLRDEATVREPVHDHVIEIAAPAPGRAVGKIKMFQSCR